GKSTFMRLLLYALGFTIPNTRKVKFEDFTIEMEIEINSNFMQIKRKNKRIWINDVEFTLPSEIKIVHATIFQDESIDLIENLLGAIYIDQDRGWTLLNRGIVIGRIRFFIEEFLHGMKGKDADIETKIALRKINDELERYKQMRTLAEYKEQIIEATGESNFTRGEISFDTHTEKLQKERKELLYMKSKIDKEISFLEKTIAEDKRFIERLEYYNIFVRTESGELIPVTRRTIENYTDNTELNKIEIRRSQIALRKINEDIAKINREINSQSLFLEGETVIEHFDRKISDIPIDKESVERIIAKLVKEQMQYRNILKESAQINNNWVDKLNIYIKNYAKEFQIDEYLKDYDYVFIRDLRGVSGAIYHKMVFIFRISYARVLSEKLGYKVPIFIDSPNGREIEKQTVDYMLELLERDFVGHQIFIATIFDIMKKDSKNKVILMDGKFFDLQEEQASLFNEL
ncbi:MAG: hypothetical protein LBV17_03185, partial [Treponema sp.]|nr:hypothetical protein [Treponema sp.]